MGTLIPIILDIRACPRFNGVRLSIPDLHHNMIERWVVGGEPKAVAEAMGIIDYDEWKDIMMMAEQNIT